MVRRALVVLCVGFVCIFVSSCGQTYKPQAAIINCPTCTVTSTAGSVPPASFNLEGIGAQGQLELTVEYSNGKSVTKTNKGSWTIGASHDPLAPSDAVAFNTSTGLAEAIVSPTAGFAACTWHATPTDPPTNSKFGYATEPYPVTVTYSENGATVTSYAYISVDASAGCYDGQAYPAPAGFPGN